jgi:hypothetical protein
VWVSLWLSWSLAEARTPSWVRRLDDRTEVCAIPIEADPSEAEVPALSVLQVQRRDLGEPLTGPLRPPVVRTLEERQPMGVGMTAMAHPLRPGWSIVRVEASVAPGENAVQENLTIAVDTSASMSSASFRGVPLLLDEPPPERGAYRTVNRLQLVREALHELVETFDDPELKVGVVAFHKAEAVELLAPTASTDHDALHRAIERIDASATEGGGEVFETMYTTAAKSLSPCGDGRLFLLTDDRPLIQGSPDDVQEGVAAMAQQGVQLHSFAVATKVDLTSVAQLTSAGGGELHRVDTLDELTQAFQTALRPVGSTVGDVSVTVDFSGPWRHDGRPGEGSSHRFDLPDPLPSDTTWVELYEVKGRAEATARFTPYFGDTSPQSRSATAKPVEAAKAPMVMRHAAAWVLAEHGVREPTDRARAEEVLESLVREVGPGREAQAILRAHVN